MRQGVENGSPPYGTGLNEQEDKKMPVVEELIRTEQDGTISFGNYTLGPVSYTHLDVYKRQLSGGCAV